MQKNIQKLFGIILIMFQTSCEEFVASSKMEDRALAKNFYTMVVDKVAPDSGLRNAYSERTHMQYQITFSSNLYDKTASIVGFNDQTRLRFKADAITGHIYTAELTYPSANKDLSNQYKNLREGTTLGKDQFHFLSYKKNTDAELALWYHLYKMAQEDVMWSLSKKEKNTTLK